jgi:hypothetical protein
MASVARPTPGGPGQRPERATLRLTMPRKPCRGKELLLRAIVPKGESTEQHLARLRASILPFSEALKAAATCGLPAHPVRVKRGVAYYHRKGTVPVDILIARLDICAELVPVVDRLKPFHTVSMPAPFDGLMEARWDGGTVEEEILILGIPSEVGLEELKAGIIEQGVQIRELRWEMDAGLPRSDAARGFFPGRAPKAIVLDAYGTSLRCDIKSHIPMAPKLRRDVNRPGRAAAGAGASYLGALAPGAMTPASYPPLPGASAPRAGSTAALASAARGSSVQASRPVAAQGAATGTSIATSAAGSPLSNTTNVALAVLGGAAQEPTACETGAGGSPSGHAGRAAATDTVSSGATTPAQPETGGPGPLAPQVVSTSVARTGATTQPILSEGSPAVATGNADVRMADGIRAQSPATEGNGPPAKRTRGAIAATARSRLGPAEGPDVATHELSHTLP